MEISSIKTSSAWSSSSNTKMTETEKEKLQEILSGYNAENISDEDLQSMIKECRDAGIRPTTEMRQMITDAGFKLPKPTTPSTDKTTSPLDALDESDDSDTSAAAVAQLLKQFRDGNVSEAEFRQKVSEITAQVLYGSSSSSSGSLLDIEA